MDLWLREVGVVTVLEAWAVAGAPATEVRHAVADLLAGAGIAANTWFVANLAAAAALAGATITRWDGLEWAVEPDAIGDTPQWVAARAPRVPFHVLRGTTDAGSTEVRTYQDDDLFGLAFQAEPAPWHPPAETAELRVRNEARLACGEVTRVEVALESTASPRPIVSEIRLETTDGALLLVAAEAYAHGRWVRHDESVVALTDPAAADALPWEPARPTWFRPPI